MQNCVTEETTDIKETYWPGHVAGKDEQKIEKYFVMFKESKVSITSVSKYNSCLSRDNAKVKLHVIYLHTNAAVATNLQAWRWLSNCR